MIQPAEVPLIDPYQNWVMDQRGASDRYNKLAESHNDLVRLVMQLLDINNNYITVRKYITVSKHCGCGGGTWWCDEHRKEEEKRSVTNTG